MNELDFAVMLKIKSHQGRALFPSMLYPDPGLQGVFPEGSLALVSRKQRLHKMRDVGAEEENQAFGALRTAPKEAGVICGFFWRR